MNIPNEGDVVVTESGGRHSFVLARFDLIPPESMKLIAQCLGVGAHRHGEENWRNIPISDHINHAFNHLNEFRLGATDEPHIVNAAVRTIFALSLAVAEGKQGTTYVHPSAQQTNDTVDLDELCKPTGPSGIINAAIADEVISNG